VGVCMFYAYDVHTKSSYNRFFTMLCHKLVWGPLWLPVFI